MVKPILQVKEQESLLRQKSSEISSDEILSSEKIKTLKTDLLDTLRAQAAGVAISAVQLGELVRLFVLEVKPTPNRPDLKSVGPVFFFNPSFVSKSDKTVKMFEACLSIDNAGTYGEVERPEKITLKFVDEDGSEQEEKYSGFIARVIQHEMDHLDGILFTDIASPETIMTAEEYREMRARK
jgi:peptide deformylase